MKPPRLLSFLRNSFFFLEWATAVSAVFMLVNALVLAPYYVSTPGMEFNMPIYKLRFDLQPTLAPMDYRGASGGKVELRNIQGELFVRQAGNPSTLLSFVRLRTASLCLGLILYCAVFSLLRRLFDNVKQGQAFSLKSVRQIRGIGWCCLAFAVIGSLIGSELDWMIGHDLRQHLTIEHIHTDFVAASGEGMNFFFNEKHLSIDLSVIWIALFAFVLAEIFRQGVLLQQDHDLTV